MSLVPRQLHVMTTVRFLGRRLLRIPLVYKILLANSAIVSLGAVFGTIVTVWHVIQFPDDVHFELIAVFAAAGLVISFVVNTWVLRRALSPLDRLQSAVDAVRAGDVAVRVEPGPASDERFDRLCDTFNLMISQLEQSARQSQEISRRIIQAQEEERYRLARDLHDEAAQALTSLLVRLRLLERANSPEDAQTRVAELRSLTAQALEEVRRVALDLRPTILDDLGLAPALEWRVDELNEAETVLATMKVKGVTDRLPRDMELVLYRVGQESLSNAARHAQADTVSVALQREEGSVQLEIVDDGVGFSPESGDDERPRGGLGLVGMRERMAMIGGHLTVESAPGQGTRVVAHAPLPAVIGSEASAPLVDRREPSVSQSSDILVGEQGA